MRSPPSPLSPLACAFPLAALAAAAGCVTTRLDGPGGPSKLEFLSPLDTAVVPFGNYHGTNLFLEVDAERDLAAREAAFLLPRARGPDEVYRLDGIHEIVYSGGSFEVGGHRYVHLARRSSVRRRQRGEERTVETGDLYVFKRRSEELRLRYRGQLLVLRARGPWVPSALLTASRGSGGVLRERLEIGSVTIEVDSTRSHWLVNGRPYRPFSEPALAFEGALPRAAP